MTRWPIALLLTLFAWLAAAAPTPAAEATVPAMPMPLAGIGRPPSRTPSLSPTRTPATLPAMRRIRSRRPGGMERLVKLEESDRGFDLEFWDRVGPTGRLAALWGMVLDSRLLQGGHGDQLRLQRSVESIQRR